MTVLTLSKTDMSLSGLFALVCVAGLVTYTLYGAIWRLYLSPVAHIPGPRFAALTFWNEFYYDVWLVSSFRSSFTPFLLDS